MQQPPAERYGVLLLDGGQLAANLRIALERAGHDADCASLANAATALKISVPDVAVIFADASTPRDFDSAPLSATANLTTWVVVGGAHVRLPPGVLSWPEGLGNDDMLRRLVALAASRPLREVSSDAAHEIPRAHDAVAPDKRSKTAHTYCLIGADDRIYDIAATITTFLGRGRTNQIVLNDLSVSRRHASLEPTEAGLRLVDQGSANGIRVNGVPVTEHILTQGDCLQVGKFVFYVIAGGRIAAAKWQSARKPMLDSEDTMADKTFRSAKASDMQGDLKAMDLPTLVQLLVEQRQSGALAMTRGAQLLGRIYFDGGQVVHAETPAGPAGTEAFYALLALQQASFAFRLDIPAPAATIHTTPTALLLEGLRRLDEARAKASA